MANDTPSAPLARSSPQAGAAIRAYQPANFAELQSMADLLARSGLVPDALRGKPADVATIIMHGASLGIDAMASLRTIHCVKGKPVLSADLTVALCVRRDDVCESFRIVESTDDVAAYEAKRRGQEPVRLSFTIDQARKAGLAGGDNWRKYPAAMLRARCSAGLARAVFPDLVAGLYDPDELAPQPAAPVEHDVTPPEPIVRVEVARVAPVAQPAPVEDPAPLASPESQPEIVVDPADALVRDVSAAGTLHDLEKVVLPKIQKAGLAGESRAKVAAAYSARRTALATGRAS